MKLQLCFVFKQLLGLGKAFGFQIITYISIITAAIY